MRTDNILNKMLGKAKKNNNNFNTNTNFQKPKPIKTTTIADKPVHVFNNHPIPSKQQINKVYKKIPDNTNIPLQFMTRQQYVKKYVANQEIKNGSPFNEKQKKEFYKYKKDKYSNIVGRYTTKNNPYYKPAVVVFNDPENQKNIKGKKFEELAWHEYGHELAEREKVKLCPIKEEIFADEIADYGMKVKIYSDKRAKNKALREIQKDNISMDGYSKNMAEFTSREEQEIHGLDWKKDQIGKLLGEGHFGRVYELKDNPNYIIKTDKDKEDHPKNYNSGRLTSIEREQYKYEQLLRDEPLVIPSLKTEQGIVRPKLNIITTGMSKDNYKTYGTKNKEPLITKDEATQVRDQVNKLTKKNINVGDEIQIGKDKDGNIYFYDLGEFYQSPDYKHPGVKDDNRDYLKRFLRETGREEVKDWDEEKEQEEAIHAINNINTDEHSKNELVEFKNLKIPVYKNPTRVESKEIYERAIAEGIHGDTPKFRKTFDTEGNRYEWMSNDAIHQTVESQLVKEKGVLTNQNQHFDIAYDRLTEDEKELVKDKYSKNMAWKKTEPYDYVEEMTPRQYLIKTNTPDFKGERYYDKETQQMEPIQKLSEHIKSKDKEVEIPYVEPTGDHEGRHRAYAAEIAGITKIPVKMTPPKSWRTTEIKNEFLQQAFPNANERYKDEWRDRLDGPFPEERMDPDKRIIWTNVLKEKRLIKEDEYSENKIPKIEKMSPFDVKTNYEEYKYNPSSAETVENMEKHIKSGGKLPPILISEDGELIDGRHRLRTYKLLNKDIPVIRGESPYASQIIKKGKELKIGKGNIDGQPYAYEIEDKETILSDEYSKNLTQSLWHAGDKPPSETLKEQGRVYGFSSKEYADGWKQKEGKQNIYQFTADEYDLDNKTYIRDTPQGKKYSDNEYIVKNVLGERIYED